MEKRIITISREFGNGGHTIGKMIAEKLGIHFYDQELVDRAIKDTGFSESFIREAGEYALNTSEKCKEKAQKDLCELQTIIKDYVSSDVIIYRQENLDSKEKIQKAIDNWHCG